VVKGAGSLLSDVVRSSQLDFDIHGGMSKVARCILHVNHVEVLYAEWEITNIVIQNCQSFAYGKNGEYARMEEELIYVKDVLEKRLAILQRILPPIHTAYGELVSQLNRAKVLAG
jgi:hypothetical protein